MESERLKIFDNKRNLIGTASREEVHRLGYWHEVFHCWVISSVAGTNCIYLQLRSETKKDYPSLFDITAAGHLLADETVRDGVREIEEEIGVCLNFEELIPIGIFDYCVVRDNFIDKELANVFLYKTTKNVNDFILQQEEVAGMVKADFKDFYKLWLGQKEEIKVSGYKMNSQGERMILNETVGKERFVPHPLSFYQEITHKIKEVIGG
ncbi:NUDIX hydrolase [Mesobacillus maritimus]|uniref:NUDIX hydrolase n=1 Tax=Mesobacillus maritimus TaxID=1643336 RepID=A0ABS7K853_9BACI|nr:NUDIX hydrolase [Mesobacillus maritimus]MBY0098436.1 NUDIX hydrolase [Mesobacillus maritimus]